LVSREHVISIAFKVVYSPSSSMGRVGSTRRGELNQSIRKIFNVTRITNVIARSTELKVSPLYVGDGSGMGLYLTLNDLERP